LSSSAVDAVAVDTGLSTSETDELHAELAEDRVHIAFIALLANVFLGFVENTGDVREHEGHVSEGLVGNAVSVIGGIAVTDDLNRCQKLGNLVETDSHFRFLMDCCFFAFQKDVSNFGIGTDFQSGDLFDE